MLKFKCTPTTKFTETQQLKREIRLMSLNIEQNIYICFRTVGQKNVFSYPDAPENPKRDSKVLSSKKKFIHKKWMCAIIVYKAKSLMFYLKINMFFIIFSLWNYYCSLKMNKSKKKVIIQFNLKKKVIYHVFFVNDLWLIIF